MPAHRGLLGYTVLVLVTLLACTLRISVHTMPDITDFLHLSTTLRFIAPTYNRDQWSAIDDELKQQLNPVHYGLSNNVITPQEAGNQLAQTLSEFLQQKPDFISDVSNKEGYIKNKPKTVQEAKKLKNSLRKRLKQTSATPADRKEFAQSVRYHNFLVKKQRICDLDNARKHQEKMYHDNFWEFSRRTCQGNIDEPQKKPTFDVKTANAYYPRLYSTVPVFNTDHLNWFPYLPVPASPVSFNMSPVKPKDIKQLLSHKKSNSAPGPDGLTYGVLRHLPSTHHFLATLYSRILLTSPVPPPTWQTSNVTLIHKRNETSVPNNFRMIALTSVIGKLFHQIISNRILDYMTSNGYISTEMQKAFIHNINGTIEHNQVLQEVITHARQNSRTCHITFFDLKDAFGSISHSLIDHTLARYQLPDNLRTYIQNLYSNISGSVLGPGWKSDPFVFKKGVFQGDPLSPTIFIMVFNPLLEYLQTETKFAYKLSSDTQIISTPFADDFNVITTHSGAHRRILKNIQKYAQSMNLIMEPTKCISLSIIKGSSTIVDFYLDNQVIPSLLQSPEKFLGSQITFTGKQAETFDFIKCSLQKTLDNIERSLVREEYKLRIYQQYMLPAIRFKLTVHEITQTNLTKLDALCDRYIRKWLSMPPSGTAAIIHAKEGLNIKSISHLYRETHAVSHASSRIKADKTVNTALDTRVDRESQWSRKGSIAVYSEHKFQQAMNNNEHTQANPSTDQDSNNRCSTIKKKIKDSISQEFSNKWYNHVKTLVVQGKFLELLHDQKSNITWQSIIYNLPRGILQFATKAAIDSLATNANLKRWGKRSNSKCELCSQKETLHHVLNFCQFMLDRYLWRHNSIIMYIYTLLEPHRLPHQEIFTDLPSKMTGSSTVPIDIVITAQKPDLVIVNRKDKAVTIFELSVPFDTNIDDTHEHKVQRYLRLISDIEEKGYSVNYFPIEIGSRGYISPENCSRLKDLLKIHANNVHMKTVKDTLSKIALVCSYVIYHSKVSKDWFEPKYVTV